MVSKDDKEEILWHIARLQMDTISRLHEELFKSRTMAAAQEERAEKAEADYATMLIDNEKLKLEIRQKEGGKA